MSMYAEVNQYLDGRKVLHPREISLFPTLRQMTYRDIDLFVEDFLKSRFRWLCQYYAKVDNTLIYDTWQAADPSSVERAVLSDYSFEEFLAESTTFGIKMLKDEVKYLAYCNALHWFIRSRRSNRSFVLMLGPTAGGEVEAIANTRALPMLACNGEPWASQAEARLLCDKVIFDTDTIPRLEDRQLGFRFVVLSPYLEDPYYWVRRAYNLLGLAGYLIFPQNQLAFAEACDMLGMMEVDPDRAQVSTYFKHPGLPDIKE